MSSKPDDRPEDRRNGHATPDEVTAIQRLLDRPLTAETLAEQTERVAQPIETARRFTETVLVFELGGEWLAWPARHVARVTGPVREHSVPHRTNDVFRGICNIDGELVLNANLSSLLRIDTAPEPKTDRELQSDHETDETSERRTLVVGKLDQRWAFPVDAVHGVVHVDPDHLQAPPLTVERALVRYTESVLVIGDHHAAVLNTERITAGFMASAT
jgi:chemotaxis-related protein WspD